MDLLTLPVFGAGGDVAGEPRGPFKSKVLLTRAHYNLRFKYSGYPIGIAYIASHLESEGVFVRLLDLALEKDWEAALRTEMAKHDYDVVGISCMITQYEGASQVARYVKENHPDTKVVVGGSFPSGVPQDCVKSPNVDVACYGEGELTLLDLVHAWEHGRPLESVQGIAFRRQDGEIVKTAPRHPIENLGEMPLPAFHLLDIERYIRDEQTSDFADKKRRSMQLITSRGCPWRCNYCHTIFGKNFHYRSAQHVMEEIRLLHDKHGVTEFVIWDDNFTMNIERAKEICDMIVNSGLDISIQLRGGVKVERMDEELMAKLRKAGVNSMCVGIESAVWRVQKLMKKNLRIHKVEDFLDLAKKYDITCIGLLMVGFPGETVAEIKETVRWARSSKLDFAFFSIVTPYPGTELHDLVVREGYYVKHTSFNEMNVMIPHVETPEWSANKIKWLQILAYLSFYSKPRRFRQLFFGSSWHTIKTFLRSLGDYTAIASFYYSMKLKNIVMNRADDQLRGDRAKVGVA